MAYQLLKQRDKSHKVIDINSETITRHQENLFTHKDFLPLLPLFKNKDEVPIGLSYPGKSPVTLSEKLLLEHMTVSGATGQGKTTLLLVQLMHSLYHEKPAIVVDPKGDLADVETLKSIARAMGKEEKIKVFSLCSPATSCSYNPLRVGTAQQIVAKLMAACDLDKASNPYYANIAMTSLSAIIEAIHHLNIVEFTIKDLIEVLNFDRAYQELLDALHEMDHGNLSSMVVANLKRLSNYRSDDLTGLRGALSSFASTEFFTLLGGGSVNGETTVINLEDVLQEGDIAYFQLNVNAYDSIARRLGKMILQDLKLISNRFQSGQVIRRYQTAAVFIDEFGSFANEDFMGFLKMSRSAGISLRLFFQSLEDLRAVSESFEGQTIGNSVYKIIFRTPAHRDANALAETAGTVPTKELTFQTEFGLFGEIKTGMGSQKEVFKFQVHPDDLKKLARGQAILIDKDAHRTTLFQTWDAKSEAFLSALSTERIPSATINQPSKAFITPADGLPTTSPQVYFLEEGGLYWALNEEEYQTLKINNIPFWTHFRSKFLF